MANIIPRQYIIGIIVFTFFIVGGLALIGELRKSDATVGGDDFTRFNDSFNAMEDVTSTVGVFEDKLSVDPDPGVFGVLNSLIGSSWNVLKTIVASLDFMYVVFGGLNSLFGIPSWAISLLILAIVVMFVFSIFSAIFQREI